MKNIILIVILLLLQNVFAEAQIFKGTPKKLSDLNFYPKPNGYPSAKIISISELNLPDVEKVFPKAKLCDIFMEGQSFVGIEKSHGYYLLYKGKYYSDFSYLSQIEQKANKNKLSTYSLKERVEAYTTVAFYKYLKGEVKVDSITYIEIADNGNGGKVLTYNFDFKVNDINYNGTIEIDDKEWITHIYIIQINRGANFASFYTKTKSLLNFINADNSEYYNNISHYYFKVEDNSNDVKIEINGLDPNEEVQCLFVDYINHSTVYETKNIIAGTNGKAYYHYFQDPVITGVYCIRVMRNNSSPILDYSKAFIPEHRLEANLSTGFKYRIYYTDMFYNSASLNISESDFVTAVKDAVEKSYQKEVTDWNFCSTMSDNNNTLDVYLHNYYESNFIYHQDLNEIHSNNIMDPLAFYHISNNYVIASDFNFPNIGNLTSLHYTSTTDFIHSGISHEFFHAVQQTIRGQSSSLLSNSEMYWLTEGTARFIQTVFMKEPDTYNSDVEFQQGAAYNFNANKFLDQRLYSSTALPSDNYNTDAGALKNLSYDYALFWRFLYEKNNTLSLTAIKYILQNINNSYSINNITSTINNNLNGIYTNYIASVNDFAKKIYLINKAGVWNNTASYNVPKIEIIPYTYNFAVPKTVSMQAAYGISIHEISFNASGVRLLQLTPLSNSSKYNVNILVYHNGQPQPDDDIHVISSQSESFPINITSTSDKLVLVFVNSKGNDNTSSIQYKLTYNTGSIVNFTPTNINITQGSSVQFHDISTGTVSYRTWTFDGGNPSSSTDQNPTVVYNSVGSYDVTLDVNYNHDIKTVQNCVTVAYAPSGLTADFSYLADPNNSKYLYFTDLSSNSPTSWSWDFGDGYTSNDKDPTHHYNYNGTYAVTLTVQNQNDESTIVKTIVVSDNHADIYISGYTYSNLIGIPNVAVNALDNNNDLIGSTISGNNGNFVLSVPYNFSGKIYAEKTGFSCTPITYMGLQYSTNNVILNLYPVQLQIIPTQVSGLYYKFDAIGAPIGTISYHWIITPDPGGSTDDFEETIFSNTLYQYFNCNPQQNIIYTVFVEAQTETGQVFAATPFSLTIYHCTNVTSAIKYPNNCKTIRKGDCVQIEDISYPFDNISRVVVWFDGNSETWDTKLCSYGGCFAPDDFIYTANCRRFEHCFSSQGVYNGALTAYNLNNQSYNSTYFDMVIVDCFNTSYNFNNSVYYLNNNVHNYYAGIHAVSSMSNISNYQNKNINVYACNEINLDGDFNIEPNNGLEVNFEIDTCLYINPDEKENNEEQENSVFVNDNENTNQPFIDNNINDIIKIFPNPNEGQFAVKTLSNEIKTLQLFNSLGEPIKTFENIENTLYLIDISTYSAGFYFLKVNTAKDVYLFKIIYSKIQ